MEAGQIGKFLHQSTGKPAGSSTESDSVKEPATDPLAPLRLAQLEFELIRGGLSKTLLNSLMSAAKQSLLFGKRPLALLLGGEVTVELRAAGGVTRQCDSRRPSSSALLPHEKPPHLHSSAALIAQWRTAAMQGLQGEKGVQGAQKERGHLEQVQEVPMETSPGGRLSGRGGRCEHLALYVARKLDLLLNVQGQYALPTGSTLPLGTLDSLLN